MENPTESAARPLGWRAHGRRRADTAAALPRACAIADALDLIGERWSLLIVREQFWGNHRFSDIQRATGAPRDILTARLQAAWSRPGSSSSAPTARSPPRAEYHLTAKGRALSPVLMAIQEWAYAHLEDADSCTARFPHGDHFADPVSQLHLPRLRRAAEGGTSD